MELELIFGKFLKKTDIESRLSVPVESLKKFPSFGGRHVVYIRVRDRRGTFWRFRCSIRKKGVYRKPVLSGAWHRFAVSKGLGVGDEFKLLKEIDQPYYRVEVKKKSTTIFKFPIREYAPVLI